VPFILWILWPWQIHKNKGSWIFEISCCFIVYYLVQQAKMPKLWRQNNLIDRTAKTNGSHNYGFYSNAWNYQYTTCRGTVHLFCSAFPRVWMCPAEDVIFSSVCESVLENCITYWLRSNVDVCHNCSVHRMSCISIAVNKVLCSFSGLWVTVNNQMQALVLRSTGRLHNLRLVTGWLLSSCCDISRHPDSLRHSSQCCSYPCHAYVLLLCY